MLETLQIINFIIVIAAGAFGLLVTFSKPLRKKIFDSKEAKESEKDEMLKRRETDKCLLRCAIVEIYYRHFNDGEIRQYEFENVSKLYNQYIELGGNSFICKIWEEIQEWTIVK